MFEMMMAEKLITDMKNIRTDIEMDRAYNRPIQIEISFTDRLLSRLGMVMVNAGHRLINRTCISKVTEQAQAPNFLIML
jgi:hypothetical protein